MRKVVKQIEKSVKKIKKGTNKSKVEIFGLQKQSRPKSSKTKNATKISSAKKNINAEKKPGRKFSKTEFRQIWNVFEHSQIPSVARTSDGEIIDLNAAAQKLIGYTKEEVPDIESWISKLYADPEYRTRMRELISKSFLQNDPEQYAEITIKTKSGDLKVIHTLYNNVFHKGNQTDIQIAQYLDVTDRKRVEEENLQQKYFIEQLLKNVPDKIYFKDLQSRFLAVSKSFSDKLNLSSEKELLGKTDFDIYDNTHANDAFNDEQQIIRSGQPIISKEEKEFWLNRDEHWALTTKMPYRDSHGKIIGTFGISRDITEMVKSRNQLIESEKRYKKLIDSSPFAILVHRNGNVVFANEACARMVKATSVNELLNKNLYDYMPLEFAAISRSRVQLISEGVENTPSFELKYNCFDGSVIDVDVTAIPILYEGIDSILVVATDITEKKLSQKRLQESEERFRLMFENHAAVMLLIDPETGKIDNANKAAIKFYGYPRQIFLGMTVFDINALPRDEVKQMLKQTKDAGENYLTFDSRLANGEIRPVEVYSCPFKFNDQTFLFSIVHDITKRKKAEDLLFENETLLKKAQKIANVGHYVLDVKTGCWICSEQMDEVLGIDVKHEKNLDTWTNVIHPDDREYMVNYFLTEVLQKHKPFDRQYRIIRFTDKQMRWVHGLGNLRFDSNGNVTEMFGTIQDITDRKKSELDLLKTQFSVDKAKDMVYWIASDGKIVYVNNAACRNTGYSEEELQSMLIFDLDPDFPREHWGKHWDESRIKGSTIIEATHKAKNGKLIPVEVSIDFMTFGGVEYHCSYARDITERKNAEHLLRIAQFATDKAQDMIYWITRDAKIIYANEASCKRLGYTREELLSMAVFDIAVDYPKERWIELWELNKELGSSVIETVHRSKEGEIIPVEISINIVAFGNEEYNFTYARDISERKKSQKELEESEDRYRSILDYSPYALMVQQEDKLIYVNAASIQLFAAQSEESLLGKNILDFVHFDNKEIFKKIIDESSKSFKPSPSMEEKIICFDGKAIDVETISVPFMSHGVFSTLFITRFVGEMKEKNEQLRKLSRAVEQSSAGIMIADDKGFIEYVNPKFSEMTGYSKEEAIGRKTSLLKSGVQPAEIYKDLWDTVLSGNEWRGELLNKKKSGEIYWESDSISSIKNKNGEITHFLAVKEDISERKKIEEDILLAKDEAEEANKVKSSLLANMSHEFRTPLNGILGFTQLLKDSISEDDILIMLEKIEKSGRRLMNTLNAVLSLTELETEEFTVQENEIDLILFCNGIKTKFERFALDKDLEFILDIQPTQLITISDESLLTKIISSICDNAIKYTQQGKIIFQLAKPITKDNTEYAAIKVTDTGMGIKKENHELIFKEFRQLSEGIRRDFEGLGLGLTLANRMARLIEAEISVESEFGKGSTFTVFVPIKTKSILTTNNELAPLNQEVQNPNHLLNRKALNILLVEDNPLNIEVVQRFLSKTGNVKAVRDGKSALKIASEEQFDLFLIDINLGVGIDGTEVLRILRLQENYKTTPAVALTGYASDTNKREFLAKGFTGYLAKPFEKKVLLNLLKELV